jgi:E3 ubiquitin-protein ligase TRIP12
LPAQDGGRDIAVDASNVDEYVRTVIELMIGSGVRLQAEAFREGFSKVFPISDLQSFTPDELSIIFGNASEDWSSESKYS